MKRILNEIMKDEEGQGMVEYGLIIAGIALAVIVAIWLLGPKIANMFTGINNSIDNRV